jgi:hypothetical protein
MARRPLTSGIRACQLARNQTESPACLVTSCQVAELCDRFGATSSETSTAAVRSVTDSRCAAGAAIPTVVQIAVQGQQHLAQGLVFGGYRNSLIRDLGGVRHMIFHVRFFPGCGVLSAPGATSLPWWRFSCCTFLSRAILRGSVMACSPEICSPHLGKNRPSSQVVGQPASGAQTPAS